MSLRGHVSSFFRVFGFRTRTRADGRACFAESPLQFYVNHANSPSVTAYGPGLSYGVAKRMATFTVVTEDASEGELAKQGDALVQRWETCGLGATCESSPPDLWRL